MPTPPTASTPVAVPACRPLLSLEVIESVVGPSVINPGRLTRTIPDQRNQLKKWGTHVIRRLLQLYSNNAYQLVFTQLFAVTHLSRNTYLHTHNPWTQDTGHRTLYVTPLLSSLLFSRLFSSLFSSPLSSLLFSLLPSPLFSSPLSSPLSLFDVLGKGQLPRLRINNGRPL